MQLTEYTPPRGGGSSLMEVSAFMTEQLKDQLREQRAHDNRIWQEMDIKMEALRLETSQKVEAATAQVAQTLQLTALQTRLQNLHACKLLADEELYKVEDMIADSLDEEEEGGGGGHVAKLVALSERMASDAAFARQLRRKIA